VTTFTAAQYSGRYGCTVASNNDIFTGVIKYNPDGAGGYAATGILIGTINNFAVFNPLAPAGQFCTWFLEPAASVYSIDSTGVGFETLSWTASIANPVGCTPPALAVFVDQDAIVLRNLTEGGASISSDFTDTNLFGLGVNGHGSCLK
jgi:hypothetical protein